MKRFTSSRVRLILVVLMSMTVVAAVVLAESYFRLFEEYVVPVPWQQARSLQYAGSIFSRHRFKTERQNVSEIPGITYMVNEQGYRGPDFSISKPAGTIRLIVYGGSAVFDQNANEGEDWPRRIEKLLREGGHPSVEVINAGVPGHASFDSLGRFIAEGHLLVPDYALIYNAWNDLKYFRDSTPLLRRFRPYRRSDDPRFNYQNSLDTLFGNYSQLYTRLRQKYFNWKLDIGPEGRRQRTVLASTFDSFGPRQYELNIKTFVDIARNAGAIPILMTQARLPHATNDSVVKRKILYEYVGMNHDALVKAFNVTDEIVRRAAATKDVQLVDTSAHFSGRRDMFNDQVHLNATGSEAIADYTAKALKSNLAELVRNRTGNANGSRHASSTGALSKTQTNGRRRR